MLVLALAACGGGADGSGNDTLTVEGRAPADTAASIRGEPLTPSTLKDPRIEQLTAAEQRILQDYVNRGIRRDSLEDPDSRRSLGGWLDSNLTVREVIALYHGTEEIKPLPPQPLPRSPAIQPDDG
ncbi:MAG: hypothetical protein BRD47_06325 [Bacteroidetes bacterium QS_8_68_28]|nr:MAG: hypothetical protein BRD47_06325 [Bacteroidetes bacterium QS_8_68_28]